MTALLDNAISRVRALPAEAQDQLARLLLDYVEDNDVRIPLTDEEAADIAAAEAEVERGDVTSAADLDRIWAKYTA